MSSALNEAETRPPATLGALFVAFLKVSMYGFGGPLVWVRRIIVDERRWLNDRDFADLLSFCQFMPGPNVVSITVCIGAKFRGPAGALAAEFRTDAHGDADDEIPRAGRRAGGAGGV